MKKIYILLFILMLVSPGYGWTQKKPAPKKPATQKKAPPKKTTTTQTIKAKAGSIPADKIEAYKEQVTPMIRFFSSTLNFLADKRNPVKEKQTVITESYLKFTWDPEVQVEDDLDDNRLVPLYKDMPAYLSDVDFFFKRAKFQYEVQDVSVQTNETGQTYFRVTANRNLSGITVNGDSVNSNKVRYIEINYDESKQQLMIVSIYTTKLNEKDDLRRWWNNLSDGWKTILGKDMFVGNNIAMPQVDTFNDTVANIEGAKTMIDGNQFYQNLSRIINSTDLDLSGNVAIADLEPLSKLSALQQVDLSGTPVSDLMPLHNTNNLEVLDISGTSVNTLEPLRYCTHLKSLRIKSTQVQDVSLLSTFSSLENLDLSRTMVTSLAPISANISLKDLRFSNTSVSDLSPLSGLTNLSLLKFSSTPVSNLDALRNLDNLQVLVCDSTRISNLEPLDKISLQRVYCNNTKITRSAALNFIKNHPGTALIYATAELTKWWNGMTKDWQNIFHFYLKMENIPTTEQLHQLVLLDSINISGRMAVTSLAPLNQLIMLRTLQCQSSGITDFEPLRNLSELKSLNAANTAVANVTPLSGLTALETLTMDNTQLADLNPLYGLKNLKFVYADNTKVNEMEGNQFMNNNPACILIFQTFENTSWWKSLSSVWQDVMLQQINVKGIPDKIMLQQIAGLEKLTITENFQISDISPATHLSRLKELQFSGTTISSLEPVSRMQKLQALRIPKNPVIDLTPVAGLSQLKELDFSNTQVDNLEPIQQMTQLEILKFSGTPVKTLKYLQKLNFLKVLEFYNTKISSLDVLEPMRSLQSLKIFNTKISEKKVEKFKISHPGCEVVYY